MYGHMQDGTVVDIYILRNQNGMVAKVISFGAILTELLVPDKSGVTANVVLGYNSLQQYEADTSNLGGTIGRYANRIAGGSFILNDKTYMLAKNNGNNSLHGGKKGFNKYVWKANAYETTEGPSVTFTRISPNLEEGFPGNLFCSVTYTLTSNNALQIDYIAHTDKSTPINLTNHSYFNLLGAGSGKILNTILVIAAKYFTPINDQLIPTGSIEPLKGTLLDFTTPHPIGKNIEELAKNKAIGGYDYNYVLSMTSRSLSFAAKAYDPRSTRVLEVWTTEPGIQLYTGNWLNTVGNGGSYEPYDGFCLEAQHFPDSVHHVNFPSVILQPRQEYRQTTLYKFTNEKPSFKEEANCHFKEES